ncbi:MAG: YecA family protein [Gammaproteobacteria bacterium]|nr:YecA family protein [Gammaproteobacteria bacterium]
MTTTANPPLSDDELQVLDAFLLGETEAGERLPLEEVHGYLTALIVSQTLLPVEDWLTAVWGAPRFADAAEEQYLTGLMQRLRQNIEAGLAAGQRFEPLVIEEEEDGEIFDSYEGWCVGFMLAVAEHSEVWEKLPKPMRELLQPIAALTLTGSEEEADLDEEEYTLCVELLPGSVAGLYDYFRQ